MNCCWMLQGEVKAPVFILLGRYGDLIQLFPAFLEIYNRTGLPPHVIVSHEYANVFDGISYAVPHIIHAHWYQGIPVARKLAESLCGGTVLQFWHDTAPLEIELSGAFVLQSHGHNWGVNMAVVPNYGSSMWRRAGFSIEEMMTLPLIFDRRDYEREKRLIALVTQGNRQNKPLLLFNFTGVSSPFGYTPEVMNVLRPMAADFHLIDVGKIKAHRLYDLLGLFDAAAGFITTDTATLHLAAGSSTPYVAFTVDGWTSSVPRGNVILEVKYSQARQRLPEIKEALNKFHMSPGAICKVLDRTTWNRVK